MTIIHNTARASIVWLIVALGTLSQAPQSSGEPPCASCGAKPAGPIAPIAIAPPPEFQAPPPETPVAVHAPTHHGDDDAWAEAPQACIKIKTRVKACAEVGKRLEYQIKVRNESPAAAHNVIIKMTMPASVKVLEASPQLQARDPDLTWHLGTIPAHGCHDIVVVVMPIGLADIKSCTRVTYEIGQCVTTKVMQFAPDGSADGRGGPGTGGPGAGGPGTGGPGTGGPVAKGFEVKIEGPAEAAIGQDVSYRIKLSNFMSQPVYDAAVSIDWGADLEFQRSSEKLERIPGAPPYWPPGLIKEFPPGTGRSLEITFRAKAGGRHCIRVKATANKTPAEAKKYDPVESTDELCTEFRQRMAGVTLEMFDRDDPILKNGATSYPITVRNQGKDPITNLTVKARIPSILTLDQVRGPGRYKTTDEKDGKWVEYEPLATLNVGETQTFEIGVKATDQVGDAKFHVEMTADQFDKGRDDKGNPLTRWVIEEESTTVVPDEETRSRIREISRKNRERQIKGTITSR